MARSDELLILLVEALAAEGCDTADDEPRLIEIVNKLRRARDRAVRDKEAAELLPLGWRIVSERQGGCKATAYNRAERGRTQSKKAAHA